jgi:hypothetical protein
MGYSDQHYMVRADRFCSSGKWDDTFPLDMKDSYHAFNLPEEIERLCRNYQGHDMLTGGFIIVVLEPYHENAYPICVMDSVPVKPKEIITRDELSLVAENLYCINQLLHLP